MNGHFMPPLTGCLMQSADVAVSMYPPSMEITLRRSQQVLLNSKASLLESAEDAGARPVYGCRIGMCKTCSCTKVSGVVRDLVTGAIDDQPNTQIRICVTEPLSAVVLDI